MKLSEFQEQAAAANKSHMTCGLCCIGIILVLGGGGIVLGMAVQKFILHQPPMRDSMVFPIFGGGGLFLALALVFFFERYWNKKQVSCPSCKKGLGQQIHSSIVIASKCCPFCGAKVIDEGRTARTTISFMKNKLHIGAVASLFALALVGCQARHLEGCSDSTIIGYANDNIDEHRIAKRRLILSDSVEHQVEDALQHNAKIESVRLAMTVQRYGSGGFSDGNPFPFYVVMTLRQPMSKAEAVKIVSDAFNKFGYTSIWDTTVAQNGNTCSVQGYVRPTMGENPNLSGLGNVKEVVKKNDGATALQLEEELSKTYADGIKGSNGNMTGISYASKLNYISTADKKEAVVLGNVMHPGMVPFHGDGRLTLLECCLKSGGINSFGKDWNYVRIIRPVTPMSGEIIIVNYQDILDGEVFDFALKPGDVVCFPPVH